MLRPVIAKKRPTTVEAMKWDGTNTDAVIDWMNSTRSGQKPLFYAHPYEDVIVIDGYVQPVTLNQWVIRDQFGEFFPLPDKVYQTVYESPVNL